MAEVEAGGLQAHVEVAGGAHASGKVRDCFLPAAESTVASRKATVKAAAFIMVIIDTRRVDIDGLR